MMTVDDEGGFQMMTSSQKSKIFGKSLGFRKEFFQSFPQNLQMLNKNFQVNSNLIE